MLCLRVHVCAQSVHVFARVHDGESVRRHESEILN